MSITMRRRRMHMLHISYDITEMNIFFKLKKI